MAYLLSIIPKAKWYSPTILMNTNSLLMDVEEIDAYIKAIVITVFLCIVCVAVSIPIINKRQLSFAEDKVDMIVCLAFVVVEG